MIKKLKNINEIFQQHTRKILLVLKIAYKNGDRILLLKNKSSGFLFNQ